MAKTIIKVFVILLSITSFSRMAGADEIINWDECVSEAKKNHPDLASAAEKIKGAKATKEITRSATLPQVTGTASESTSNNSAIGSGTSTDYEYGGSIQQLLFDGFKTSYSLSSNERTIEAFNYNYYVVSSNVRLQLRTAYANLLASQELIKVTQEIADRRKQTLDLVKLRYEGGREHKGSLLTSEADFAKAVYGVNQAKRNIYLSQRKLIRALGRKTFFPYLAVGGLDVKDTNLIRPDFEKLCEITPSLQQLIFQKEAARFSLKSAKAGFFPQVYVTGTESNADTDSFPRQNQWSLGTSLTWPLFDGGNTIATVQKARATLNQAEADEKSGRDSVVLTLSNTWTELQNAVENVAVQKKVLDAAEIRARIATAEYSIGLLTYDNWIIIEDNLVSAKTNFVNTQLAALLAEANWVQAKGGTLDYD